MLLLVSRYSPRAAETQQSYLSVLTLNEADIISLKVKCVLAKSKRGGPFLQVPRF